MPIRWNTTHVEIDRGIRLRPAVNQWVEQLDKNLTGKKKTAASKKKRKWYLGPLDWELLEALCEILGGFHQVTLKLSKGGIPTICLVLPLYKYMETHLQNSKDRYHSAANLHAALQAGLDKLTIHLNKALVSQYPLLGTVLHPCFRLKYFKRADLWAKDIPTRAKNLLKVLYDEYMVPSATAPSSSSHHAFSAVKPKAFSILASTMSGVPEHNNTSNTANSELELYYSNAYPCVDEDGALEWWKVSLDFCRLCRAVISNGEFADTPKYFPGACTDCARYTRYPRSQHIRGALVFIKQAHPL
ncbi:hypothetical protein B0H21DRAFT_697286 [Amylocystis lapponica]|nr:hypothetical protein B0H21DRAFT_697286 [Amylocystis lapponica]